MDAFPHLNINVKDDTIYVPIQNEILPLHRPHYAMKTEKGPVGVPVWCSSYARAVQIFGDKQFDKNNADYFSRASVFLLESFKNNGAFITRLGLPSDSTTMKRASYVLLCTVPASDAHTYTYTTRELTSDETISSVAVAGSVYPIAAFEVANVGAYGNEYGFRLFADPTVSTFADIERYNAFIYTLGFVKKDLDFDTFTKLKTRFSPYQFNFASKTGVVNPSSGLVMDFDSSFTRNYGNTYPSPIATHVYNANIKAITDHVVIKYLATSSDDVKKALGIDVDATDMVDLAQAQSDLDDATAAQVLAAGVVTTAQATVTLRQQELTSATIAYNAAINADPQVPQDITDTANAVLAIFNANGAGADTGTLVTAQAALVVAQGNLDTANDDVADAVIAYNLAVADSAIIMNNSTRINILNMNVTLDDGTFSELGEVAAKPVIAGGIVFNKNTAHYLTGGDDGETDIAGKDLDSHNEYTVSSSPAAEWRAIEALIADVFDPDINQNIVDKARYPFNTIFDTGYSVTLKNKLSDFLAVRDDVKVILSTYFGETQIEAEANAVGTSLVGHVRLTPESELFGTGCFRADIFGQAGILNGEVYKKAVPLTIWYASKMAEFHNLTYLNKQPTGLPNSYVSMFKSINWIPALANTKRDMWDQCINYCQYSDMTHVHFPGLKTVYAYDTSTLSTDSFSNTLIYIKQLVLPVWAKYAGVEATNIDALYAQIINDLNARLSYMLADKYTFITTMYQTEEEAKIGYVHHVNIEITAGPSQRVWNVDIICKRTNFEG